MKRLLIFLVLCLFWTSCAKEKPVIRIGINPWPGYEFLYMAQIKGMYEAKGLKVQLVDLGSLVDVRRAFERGQVDVMASTLVEVVVAHENGPHKPQIFHVADFSYGADHFLIAPSLKDIRSLKGKKIGMEVGSLDAYVSHLALRGVGLTLDSVQVVPVGQGEMLQKFRSGEIQGAPSYPPFSVECLRAGVAKDAWNSSHGDSLLIDVISADSAFLVENAAEMKLLQEVFFEAVAWYEANRVEATKIMAQREKLSVQEFEQGMSGLRLVSKSEQSKYFQGGRLAKALANVDQALRSQGLLKNPVCGTACVQGVSF